ncbi:MAG: HIT family protein [Candidatus Aenigmatarchaeota archaeon]
MSEGCLFCREPEGIREDMIKRYEHWDLFLNRKQHYLGRSIVKLKRHVEDLFKITGEERKELFEVVVPETKNAIDSCFEPDLYNYASLGNSVRHLHLHVIPRYRDEREFDGVIFRDERWGHNYKPYPEFDITEDTKDSILDVLREEIG